ncbi:hypothetical protein [Bradyrhizobium sp. 2S1]|uniref:hypothetical protein n=1 Tax=Bradyrhizobium sp. 2S1 TaxID=1404429 RepID=UPI00140BE057|nr:hypothetical protein [Bradyrhizobium sp. 2S1]MCK7672351.1 hypothetical protein [Bradyrhizobium sp. 2S1]
MGPIIAQLSRMGLTNIGFELITDVPAFKRNERHEVSAEDFALAFVNEHLTFSGRDLSAHFKAAGRTASSSYYAVRKLIGAGEIVDLGDRNYQRADVRAIEPPKTETAPKKFDTPASAEILKFARKHGGKFNTEQLVALFAEQGRARGTVYGSVNKMLTEKLIKRVGASGSGDYMLLAKAKAKSNPKKPATKAAAAPAAKLNGANHETAETVNG